MAWTQVPTRTTADSNSAADVNQLELNAEALKGGTASVAPTTTIEALATLTTNMSLQTAAWIKEYTSTSTVSAGGTTAGTWYNPSSHQITLTAGTWRVHFACGVQIVRSAGAIDCFAALAVDSAAINKLYRCAVYDGASSTNDQFYFSKTLPFITVATDTVYKLWIMSHSGSMTTFQVTGAECGTIIHADRIY